MLTRHCVLWGVLVAVSSADAGAQTESYWLIKETRGRWEYVVGDAPPRKLSGQYEPIVAAGRVRCLEPDLKSCELRYLIDPRSNATRRLEVKLGASGRWTSLRELKPPPPPVLPATIQ